VSGPRGTSRRGFLRGLSAGAALSLSGPLFAALSACAREEALRAPLAGFFADPASAAVVGREYLAAQREEADADTLVSRLVGSARARFEDAAGDPARLAALLRERHRADFEAGSVAVVRGWILSRTEARLCALAALGHAPREGRARG
jgi:hypothetical protein